MNAQQQRIIDLHKALKIAKKALDKIRLFSPYPHAIAENALDEIFELDKAQPLQGLVGHKRRVP